MVFSIQESNILDNLSIQREIAALNPYDTILLWLRFQGRTTIEIGEMLDCTHSAIVKQLKKIYLRLTEQSPVQ